LAVTFESGKSHRNQMRTTIEIILKFDLIKIILSDALNGAINVQNKK
jgi:hypothetical protein